MAHHFLCLFGDPVEYVVLKSFVTILEKMEADAKGKEYKAAITAAIVAIKNVMRFN